jgi:hypothetical protein
MQKEEEKIELEKRIREEQAVIAQKQKEIESKKRKLIDS